MPPATDGQWDAAVDIPLPPGPLPIISDGNLEATDTRGIFVLHAVVLHTGKLLWFCGHTEGKHYPTLSYVWDPTNPGTTKRVPFPPGTDFFCCHYVQIADGRILAVGGSDFHFGTSPPSGGAAHGSVGAKTIVLFDPVKEAWENTGEELHQGRWYPTAVLLGDGRVAVFSGRREHPTPAANQGIADEVEIINPPHWKPRKVGGTAKFPLPIYPGLHLAPDGRIFFTHTCWGQEIPNPSTRALTIAGTVKEPTGSWNDFGGALFPAQRRREEGMSALLPPAQDGKILVTGGTQAFGPAGEPIVGPTGGGPNAYAGISDPADAKTAEILDTKASPPTWSPAPGVPMNEGRTSGHQVLLPTRQVLLVGGHDHYKWEANPPTTPSLRCEIFTPGTGFAPVASMAESRMYHSVATLIPDGRVVVAGGADANEFEPTIAWPAGWISDLRYGPTASPLNRKTYQVYEPPYMHNGPRPQINAVKRGDTTTTQVEYGQEIFIDTLQAADIDHVAIMRPGAPTHHTDTEQRYVELTFTKEPNRLKVTMLPATDSNIAPPGYYFLWIVDSSNRPCRRAYALQVSHHPPGPAFEESSGCPCAMVEGVSLPPIFMGLMQLAYLRMLRGELETSSSPLARRWMAAVNKVYWWMSPSVAGWLRRHDQARASIGPVVVRRLVRAVLRADRRSRRTVTLVANLTLTGLAALTLAPFAALAVAVDARRRPRRG